MDARSGPILCAVAICAAVAAAAPARAQAPPAARSPAAAAPAATAPAVPAPRPRPASPVNTDALNADIRGAAEFQSQVRAELDSVKGDRARFNQLLVDTTTRLRTVEQQITDLEARITTLDGNAAELRASLFKRRDVLAEVLGALVRMGRNPPPALLMRPDDALDAVRSAILLGALLPEMRVEAETLAADLADLSRLRTDLATARDTLTGLRTSMEEDRRRLSAYVTERQKRVTEGNADLPAEKAQADAVAKTTGDVHDLVTRLETEVAPAARAAAEATSASKPPEPGKTEVAALNNAARIAPARPFVQAKGLLPLPVAGVRLRDFGTPDGLGGAEKGMTFATRAGAQVAAPADGWVVYAGPFRSYGQLLIINAGGGYHILLAGMERITVELGQFVLAGEPVAIMGSVSRAPAAGSASGQPQLYVEFRKDGISIDPAPWWAATDSQKVRG
ncbi:murein hydrolase activator EnvC family protein [Azorhizobium doebereinerae]|uniref:murein hydrolase activator EnvC family protein n=1 Tax=Azorhizobium doebereinerae TaxID=281091 RepID=UPI00048AC3B1|nr:peptidoglycan DD-metalloendopeptidase family protein [Azorhizobium doebereinerae]